MSRLLGSRLCQLALGVLLLALGPIPGSAQTALISEEIRVLDTYPFSEPNPIPILVRDPRLYPYHSFEGYSVTSEPREWKVVKLENDYIEVFVLPEVGGKVWGAVVKETGHEFIYRNEVMKFRNIALRGPWTSGGIEFNFGVIGHTPATATPVDYTLVTNPDGSVSCWVGSMDLPSRTHWRVEIRLPTDRAYFETNVLWYNPTPLEQPYYNWMTAAAFAQDDLEMSMPGDAYLKHSGQVEEWPRDEEDRYLPLYGNNTFEGHKSYHVVGELNDFFGGYYHDEDYGFGHWARYEDMPGQKLWLWALSREGGVWEDLLTDTDGQYVEFQAGRLLVQYSPGSHVNPITQAGFDPMSASRWTETWFPLEGTGGLTDASREGALYASEEGGYLTVGVNAFREIRDTLWVWSDGELVATAPVNLTPLKPLLATYDVLQGRPFRVRLAGLGLDYESDPAERRLTRPFDTDPEALPSIPEVDRKVFQARELMKGREYRQARGLFEEAVAEEPWNREALLGLAEISHRRGLYGLGLEHANRALQLDAYDAKANFLAGNLYRALDRPADAREAFGWAARSTAYRSPAYVQLAEIMLATGDWAEATRYARLAIDFDRYSIPGWRALAVVGRKTEDEPLVREARSELLALDPLHHFVTAEEYLDAPDSASGEAFLSGLGGEYPDQTLLELAIGYEALGQRGDAYALLGLGEAVGPDWSPLIGVWKARLEDSPTVPAGNPDPGFVFPYRPETLPVLEWAADNNEEWVWSYLLALNLWALDRREDAANILESLEDRPDHGPFFVARGRLLEEVRGSVPGLDLNRAVVEDGDDRALYTHLIRYLENEERWGEALLSVKQARERFENDFNLDLLEAKALLNLDRGQEAVEILAATHVLPSENARESHLLWEQAHMMVALDAYEAGTIDVARENILKALEWPESLGQGRPYQPEERLARFILGKVEEKLDNEDGARVAFDAVLEATGKVEPPLRGLDLLALRIPEFLSSAGPEWRRAAEALDPEAISEGRGEISARLLSRALLLGSEGK